MNADTERHRWVNPNEWIGYYAMGKDRDFLWKLFVSILDLLDPEMVEETFKKEMLADGYFDPLEPELDTEQCDYCCTPIIEGDETRDCCGTSLHSDCHEEHLANCEVCRDERRYEERISHGCDRDHLYGDEGVYG